MATLSFPRINYVVVVITLIFFHCGYYIVTATPDINNINDGFSAPLIRKTSPKSTLQKHRNDRVSRELISPEEPLELDPITFEHIIRFSMGTPPVDIHLIADTGSDLIWTQCEPCKKCYKSKYGVFDPRKSSTHKNITCRSRECRLQGKTYVKQLVEACMKEPTSNCYYACLYEGGSNTFGNLGKETISFKTTTEGSGVTLKDIIFGCGYYNNKTANSENDMGVFGLGRGPLSFVSQMAPHVGSKKFSHCFTSDAISESKIYFGNKSVVSGEGAVTLPLGNDENDYLVTMSGITVGDEFLQLNSTPGVKNNMVIDSGTPFTRLPKDLFDRVAAKLQKAVPVPSYFDATVGSILCFNTTTPPKLPKISFRVDNGGELEVIDDQLTLPMGPAGQFCLTMAGSPGEKSSAIFGGFFQMDYLVGFDLDKNVVSFKQTNCKDYNQHN